MSKALGRIHHPIPSGMTHELCAPLYVLRPLAWDALIDHHRHAHTLRVISGLSDSIDCLAHLVIGRMWSDTMFMVRSHKKRRKEGLVMTLKFQHQRDVKLGRSPLTHVICQVRFSPILRIGAEQPASFQEAIRHQFPIYELEQSFSFQVPVPAQANMVPSFQLAPSAFRFKSEDGHSAVTLAQDSFSLTTDRYTTWEDFAKHLEMVSEAVRKEYNPSPILRVGLRYVNEFSTDKLGFRAFDEVLTLFQPELVSPFTANVFSMPKAFSIHMDLEDQQGTLAFRFGLPAEGLEQPKALVLDLDYYEETASTLDGLVNRCDKFHEVIYDAFRWAIVDDRLSVFHPLP